MRDDDGEDSRDEDSIDRDAILGRRARFVALALAGLLPGCGARTPAQVSTPTTVDGGVVDSAARRDQGAPVPCLGVAAPDLGPPARDAGPQACLDVALEDAGPPRDA